MSKASRGGLADRLHAGFEDDRILREREFAGQLRARAKQHGRKESELAEDRRQLDRIDGATDDLRREAAADPGQDDVERRRYYARAIDALGNARQNIHARQGAPLLRAWSKHAEDLARKLDSGEQDLKDASPNQLSAAYAYSTRHDPHTLTPESDTVQAARSVLEAARSGRPEQALPGLNRLYANDLQGYVGKPSYDGGTICAPPRIVAAHPNPREPSQTTLVANFTVRHPDGREGGFTRPLMLHGNHVSLHPEDDDQHPVLSLDTGEFIHHTLGLATTILTTQHPGIQAKLEQASPEQSGYNRFLLDLSTRLGTRDSYTPRMHYEFDGNGDMAVTRPSGGLVDIVRMPRRGLAEPGTASGSEGAGRLRKPAGSGADSDPYIKGRLYQGQDGRRARYLGSGKWGAP